MIPSSSHSPLLPHSSSLTFLSPLSSPIQLGPHSLPCHPAPLLFSSTPSLFLLLPPWSALSAKSHGCSELRCRALGSSPGSIVYLLWGL